MEIPAAPFLGSILRATACTPNKNFDEKAYNEGVVKPLQRIRALLENRGERPLSEDEMKEVLQVLLLVLETKMVDKAERVARFNEILEHHQVQHLFADLMPQT